MARGPAPKPPEQRRRRNVPERGDWIDIPADARIDEDPPALPVRDWTEGTLRWWAELWQLPQATLWPNGCVETLARLALLRELVWTGAASAADRSEIRQIEDRFGLNPKGLRDLRWRIVDELQDDDVEAAPNRSRKASNRRKAALKLVEGDGS